MTTCMNGAASSARCSECRWIIYVKPPVIAASVVLTTVSSAAWHFPPKAAGQGFGQGTGDIIEYMAALQPSNHTQRHAWLDPDFLMTE